MPFMGQDWRSPGDQWVKTSEGWEQMKLWRVKIFENLNENVVARINRLTIHKEDIHDKTPRSQPNIVYNSGGSKEKMESTSLSEALVRLDMSGAARDITRANYVLELLILILKEYLPNLSGRSQKLIFNIIESMLNEALKSELNFGHIKQLVECAEKELNAGKMYRIGSPVLWNKHLQMVERFNSSLKEYCMKKRDDDGKLTLPELPTECLRIIFSQIPDHKDLMRASQANLLLNEMTEESLLWKSMCLYHFSSAQINTFLDVTIDDKKVDWKYIYMRCYKRFGKKDTYCDMLCLCLQCSSIHWKSLGHPCAASRSIRCRNLSPKDFMGLFKQ